MTGLQSLGDSALGRTAVADVARSFLEAFPDRLLLNDETLGVGERIACHWSVIGTNTGPEGAGPPVIVCGFAAKRAARRTQRVATRDGASMET